jgi:hypothetical protein
MVPTKASTPNHIKRLTREAVGAAEISATSAARVMRCLSRARIPQNYPRPIAAVYGLRPRDRATTV